MGRSFNGDTALPQRTAVSLLQNAPGDGEAVVRTTTAKVSRTAPDGVGGGIVRMERHPNGLGGAEGATEEMRMMPAKLLLNTHVGGGAGVRKRMARVKAVVDGSAKRSQKMDKG